MFVWLEFLFCMYMLECIINVYFLISFLASICMNFIFLETRREEKARRG